MTIGKVWDSVKIIHASDLKTWTRFPAYRDHKALSLGEYHTLRAPVEAVLWDLRELMQAQDSLAQLHLDTPVEYDEQEVDLPRSVGRGEQEITLPEPKYAVTTIACDVGKVSGQVLKLPPSRRKRIVTARYLCPSHVLNADEITKLKASVSAAGPEAHARLAQARASRYRHPVLFISHRWERSHHPDPEGRQLRELQTLSDCFLIYDYASFPQGATAARDKAALQAILSDMNELISNVVVLKAPDYLKRGWCIYEYVVASMRASLVCDELSDPRFVMLRNLAATTPPLPPRMRGHSIESGIQNAKSQRTLETINGILPLFNQSRFAVEQDRQIVRALLVAELRRTLPGKKEYQAYLGEWTTKSWTEEELQTAFTHGLKWEPDDTAPKSFTPFEPQVPATLAEAVTNVYRLDEMPQGQFTWAKLLGTRPFAGFEAMANGFTRAIRVVALIFAGIIALILAALVWLLVLLVRHLFS